MKVNVDTDKYIALLKSAERFAWLRDHPEDALLIFAEATNQDTFALEREQIIPKDFQQDYIERRTDELAALRDTETK